MRMHQTPLETHVSKIPNECNTQMKTMTLLKI